MPAADTTYTTTSSDTSTTPTSTTTSSSTTTVGDIGNGKDDDHSAELKKDAHEAGEKISDAARSTAKAAGTALEKAGHDLKKHAEPGDQH